MRLFGISSIGAKGIGSQASRLALWALGMLVAGLPARADARPVTRVLDLTVGQEQFARVGSATVAVDAPEIVAAEILPSGELLLMPKAPGRALLYVMGPGGFDVVRVRVRETGGKSQEIRASEEQIAAARKACPGLEIEKEPEGLAVVANVVNGACRKALLTLLATDDFTADRASLMFSEDSIREQLEEIRSQAAQRGLDAGLKLAYLGATLRIEGTASSPQKLELLKLVYEATPGRLLLDDRSEIAEPEKADAGKADESQKSPGTLPLK